MKRIFLVLLFIVMINGVLPTGTSLHAFFDPNVDSVYESPIVYSDALSFELSTSERVLCRYDSNSGTSFDSMVGSFDENFETIHKTVFTGLSNGIKRIYVKCRDIDDLSNTSSGVAELEVVFKISVPIAGQVVLEKSGYLSEGKHEVTLVTTKIPSATPKLSYSFNGIVYNPIALHGSDTVWKGFLFISEDQGESVGSFKFEGYDLENRRGEKLVGDVVFSVDTISPKTINSINAVGDYGEIKLDWYLEEEVQRIFVYRSEETGVDKTDLLAEIDGSEEEYIDDEVTKGKTYFYKISAEDKAGNIADLSKEVSATALLSEKSNETNTGLALNLRGLVDNLLMEISTFSEDISDVEGNYDLSETARGIFEGLEMDREVSDVKRELGVLKKEVENYKLQDITREVLESKLNSASLKLNILKKRVPESFVILSENKIDISVNEEVLRKLLLEYNPEWDEKEISNRVKSSEKVLEEKKFAFEGMGYVLEVVYIDGTRKEFSYVEQGIKSEMERNGDFKLVISLPDSFVNGGNLDIKDLEHNFESNNLVSFSPETKEIEYSLDKKVSEGSFKDIKIGVIDVSVEEESGEGITGYSIFNFAGQSSAGFTFLMLVVFILAGYWGYLKFIQKSGTETDVVADFIDKARKVKELQKSGEIEKANEIYESLKVDYIGMDNHEKKRVFKEIKQLRGGK